jgi:hypothetical protein
LYFIIAASCSVLGIVLASVFLPPFDDHNFGLSSGDECVCPSILASNEGRLDRHGFRIQCGKSSALRSQALSAF